MSDRSEGMINMKPGSLAAIIGGAVLTAGLAVHGINELEANGFYDSANNFIEYTDRGLNAEMNDLRAQAVTAALDYDAERFRALVQQREGILEEAGCPGNIEEWRYVSTGDGEAAYHVVPKFETRVAQRPDTLLPEGEFKLVRRVNCNAYKSD